jgi:hypothetical protein
MLRSRAIFYAEPSSQGDREFPGDLLLNRLPASLFLWPPSASGPNSITLVSSQGGVPR